MRQYPSYKEGEVQSISTDGGSSRVEEPKDLLLEIINKVNEIYSEVFG